MIFKLDVAWGDGTDAEVVETVAMGGRFDNMLKRPLNFTEFTNVSSSNSSNLPRLCGISFDVSKFGERMNIPAPVLMRSPTYLVCCTYTQQTLDEHLNKQMDHGRNNSHSSDPGPSAIGVVMSIGFIPVYKQNTTNKTQR